MQPGEADLWPLAEKLGRSTLPRPKLFLSCGTEDSLLTESRAFRDHLDHAQIAATYEESPGTHEWGYWDAQIQRVLEWL